MSLVFSIYQMTKFACHLILWITYFMHINLSLITIKIRESQYIVLIPLLEVQYVFRFIES